MKQWIIDGVDDAKDAGEAQGRSLGAAVNHLKFWNWSTFQKFQHWLLEQRKKAAKMVNGERPPSLIIINQMSPANMPVANGHGVNQNSYKKSQADWQFVNWIHWFPQ